MLKCDFCSAPPPHRTLYCVPFEMADVMGIVQMSDNAWAACEDCAKLIDQDRWEALAQRSANSFLNEFPVYLGAEDRAVYLNMLRELHQRFRKARTGQTRPH